MGDLTMIILSMVMVIFCWILIRLNDKIDRHIKRFKKLEGALIKNSSSTKIKIDPQNQQSNKTPFKDDVPLAKTSRDLKTNTLSFTSKK